MLVAPQFRGRGLQRALVAARARAAIELGCDLVGAAAEPGWVSADNIERAGMRPVGTRGHYIYEPK
jgi:GNAT superfamily N-acetyltransferase